MPHDYYARSLRALQLAGMSDGTQTAYTRALRLLVEFYDKPPEQITEAELEEYLLHRRNVDKWAPKTLGVTYSGIKFYFITVLQREWHLFTFLRAEQKKGLSTIIGRGEVDKLLASIRTLHNFTCLATIYTCGLRTSEAVALRVPDIYGDIKLLHVHDGKGGKDRYVPLPTDTLDLLRRYWVTHRHKEFVFPVPRDGGDATQPVSDKAVQRALRKAVKESGLSQRITPHTLRHCYATHLLEAGVNPRIVQHCMGHANLETTEAYLHVTKEGMIDATQIIDQTMGGVRFQHAPNHH